MSDRLPWKIKFFTLAAWAALGASMGISFGKSPSDPAATAALSINTGKGPALAVLDPVDLGLQAPVVRLGDFIRKTFRDKGRWQVLSREDQDKSLQEYRQDPNVLCKEYQCGFDAGSVLQTDYILYGTVTDLDGFYSFTLNLLYLPTAQVVLTEVGEVAKGSGTDPLVALESRLGSLLGNLDPARLSLKPRSNRGLMAVLDLSESTRHSQAMLERITSHVQASRHFDIMGQAELDELLKALEIGKSSLNPTPEAIFRLGDRLNVTHLVYSRLSRQGSRYDLELALYDIRGRRKVREWPSSAEDFRKLLQFENKFFSTLAEESPARGDADVARSRPGRRTAWKWAVAGTGMVAGTFLGYQAYRAYRDAEREYTLSQSAYSGKSAESHRRRTEELDTRSRFLGGLGALGLGLSLTLTISAF